VARSEGSVARSGGWRGAFRGRRDAGEGRRGAERLVMRTAQGPFPMETTYTWQAVGDGSTRMTLRNRGEPAGFSALAAPVMTSAIRRANRKDLRKLRSILEADNPQ